MWTSKDSDMLPLGWWLIVGVVVVASIVTATIRHLVRARRSKRAKAEKAAAQAAARAAADAERARREALRPDEQAKQKALAEATLNGDEAAWNELQTTAWLFAVDHFTDSIERFFAWKDTAATHVADWRAAIAARDLETAIQLESDYSHATRPDFSGSPQVSVRIEALGGITGKAMYDQTKAMIADWLADETQLALAGSSDAYRRMKQYRVAHTPERFRTDRYAFTFSPGWNDAVILHEPVPHLRDFDWSGLEMHAGEPRLRAARAIIDRDLKSALMLLAWFNHHTYRGATLDKPFAIESELRAQLALMVEEMRQHNQRYRLIEATQPSV